MHPYLRHVTAFTAAAILFFHFSGAPGLCYPTLPLDEETVFCLYYKVSGERLEEQDLEELAFSSGRPMFTLYKPSEIFTKNSLTGLRDRMLERIKALDSNAAFKWVFTYSLDAELPTSDKQIVSTGQITLPQPTPSINSEISKRGRKSINKVLRDLARRGRALSRDGALAVTLYLRPEKTRIFVKRRNVALVDVSFPLRRIVFRPVMIEVSNSKTPGKSLLVYRPGDGL